MTREEFIEHLDAMVPAATTFILRRTEDPTGISGTGVVADGCVFPDGKTVTRWRTSTGSGVAQTCVWDSIAHVAAIHGHGGATRIEFVRAAALIVALRRIINALTDEDWSEWAADDVLGAMELADWQERPDASS